MDHLDLAAILTTPPQWNVPQIDQQDAVYLSSSRQMLEPIIEETSEDEEYGTWNQCDQLGAVDSGSVGGGWGSFWSSAESETGSVIRIEVTKDNDSTSERDLLCPAKRPRRSEETTQQQQQSRTFDEEVVLRKPLCADTKNNSLERFINYENNARDSWGANGQQRLSLGNKRSGMLSGAFDDGYSDSDSLSFNSLSRSSSLIQFESLERQLQEQHASMSSLGNSSPSLLSFDIQTSDDNQVKSVQNSANNSGNNSRRGSQSSLLKKYESLDGRLHQTYYDLDKLNFEDVGSNVPDSFSRVGNAKHLTNLAELRSDSESSYEDSDTSNCRPQSVLSPFPSIENENEFVTKRLVRTNSRKGKSSAENLSEDSGYCEPSMGGFGLRRSKSQTHVVNYDAFSELEEEEEYVHIPVFSSIHLNGSRSHENSILEQRQSFMDINLKHSKNKGDEDLAKNIYVRATSVPLVTSPSSPRLDFIRQHQRSQTHSPSPTISEKSSSSSASSSKHSSCSSGSSSSSATTCASKASFTWLISIPPEKQISLNDQREQETSCEEEVIFNGKKKYTIKAHTGANYEIGEQSSDCENESVLNRTFNTEINDERVKNKIIEQQIELENKFKNKPYLESDLDEIFGISADCTDPPITACRVPELHANLFNSECNPTNDTLRKLKYSKLFKRKSSEYNNTSFPEYSIESEYSSEVSRRHTANLMLRLLEKAASEPHALNYLGRKKKTNPTTKRPVKSGNEYISDAQSSSEEEVEQLELKRSYSWSYNESNCSGNYQATRYISLGKLGTLHKSYHNLALLEQDTNEFKDMAERRRISSDCETELVCKNNFLLDELSAHFDRTSSILNDQTVDSVEINCLEKPIVPARHRKHSNSSYSEKDDDYNGEVQHVQLVIRKPPARQKKNKDKKANSLTNEITLPGLPQKTFDQDPTNLKTSYSQSLEKCNFDARELSTQDLNQIRSNITSRRFHLHTNASKKKNIVSSTPNLNAFAFNQEDIDDELFVSSTHNSMHQLPTPNQKPLGILLAGSRTSSKEVSFCPIVSKYSWQEQSSEECTDGIASEREDATVACEESDDELLDNADETVIQNTKENENIGNKFKELQRKENIEETEKEKQQVKRPIAITQNNKEENPREAQENKSTHIEETIETEKDIVMEQVANKIKPEMHENVPAAVSITTNINSETLIETDKPDEVLQKILNLKLRANNSEKTTVIVARPISLQLPILSEPPINRAHHILYASQQMLDHFEKHKELERENSLKTQSTHNLSSMSAKSREPLNNNKEVAKSKFKADEKHPQSKGFLSRFTNGFRLSMRRNKNKQFQQQKESSKVERPAETSYKQIGATNNGKASKNSKHQGPDYIHIPLKGPMPAVPESENLRGAKNMVATTNINAKNKNVNKPEIALEKSSGVSNERQQKVTGKPPIPPQQQSKTQGAQSTQPQQQQQQQPVTDVGLSRFYTDTLANKKPSTPADSLQSTLQEFLTNERYLANQQRQSSPNHNTQQDENMTDALDFMSPLPATVSDKTQFYNNLSCKSNGANVNNVQLGLIETNLDTHETVITGKTRSLINIGPQQFQETPGRYKSGSKRNSSGGVHHHHPNHHQTQLGERLEDYYDDDGCSKNAQVQIVSVRRPHKSMEFLLDKDNQKDIMPPENELQKSHDHNPVALSEHQIRIQASLQRLNIPDWFRQYNQKQKSPEGADVGTATYKPGHFTRKRTQDSGRWAGLNSKTTSLSSLGSQRSDRSPLLLSPSAHSHHGGQMHQHHQVTSSGTGGGAGAFSRWSTSHLNSSQTSPSVSQRGSFTRGGPINSSFISVNSGQSAIRNSMRLPYLGWRSTEKLSQRTAHERLASSMLAQQQRTSPTTGTAGMATDKLQPVTPEIQTSIKEVTSAIVHYVNDQTNQQRSRSASPNSRKCWLESSFVGTRPLDSPQTPVIEQTPFIAAAAGAVSTSPLIPITTNNYNKIANNHSIEVGRIGHEQQLTRMNISSSVNTDGGSVHFSAAPERSLSNASLEDVLASLLGLPAHAHTGGFSSTTTTGDVYARSSTGQQPKAIQQQNLEVLSKEEQQRLRRRSEGDAPSQKPQELPQNHQHQQHQYSNQQHGSSKLQHNAKGYASDSITTVSYNTQANGHAVGLSHGSFGRRVSLGDSSESNNKTASGDLQIKCRNNKCDNTATHTDAKKYYKSCHNCTYLYCSRECRRANWEKHRKACLHSRVSTLCRQVLASCKDDRPSLRHLSLLARKGFLSQGRGVVRILFRSPESAEGFIKNGFQCMGEASYVRWPDLMPAEMGLELYSELLKLSTEYRPDSKMLVYVAVCVVSEAPGNGQAPVRWERQLVSRCAKLKLCKTVLNELEQLQKPPQQQQQSAAAPEPTTTEVLILTFNPQLRHSTVQRELILSNILDILSRRGVILRKHYPEIFQRLQSYAEGQTDKFNPVTLHPRDSNTGKNFVCIIMPVLTDAEIIKLPSLVDGGNLVTSIDAGSPNALALLDDDELLTRNTS